MSTFADRFTGFVDDVGVKLAVLCATTANIALYGLVAIDGITPEDGKRVLVKDQTDPTENGLYNASTGSWERTVDFASARNVMSGARTLVLSGAANGQSEWYLSTLTDPIIVGTTALAFTRIPVTSDEVLTEIISNLGLMPAPVGTRLLFQQTAAPTGWTKVTSHNNKALRIVSGTVGSGGSQPFTTAFTSRTPTGTVGDTTLDLTQIPAHPHPTTSGGKFGEYVSGDPVGNGLAVGSGLPIRIANANTGNAGGGLPHTHGLTMNAMAFDVNYVDVILASKD